ncbi:AMP-binding protein [Nocardia rhizosphaerihabitans]|uniref:AMP-binding protein n=1 Tax=Nocardia rhizosphaerihabitans TaxID=1691570 RepID=UPI00366F38B5
MPNVADSVWLQAASAPDRVAVTGSGRRLTFSQLRDGAARVAGAVLESGLQPGSRVLLVAPSVPEFPVVYYGLHAAGMIVLTPNTMSTRREVEYLMEDAGCSLAVAWHGVGPAPVEAAKALGVPCWTFGVGATGIVTAESLSAPRDRDLSDTAVLLYTSGTIGSPKGAELTVGNLRASAEIFREAMHVTSQDVFGTALPLFHIYGQATVMGTALLSGAAISLMEVFDASKLVAQLESDGVTILGAVPTMFNALLRLSDDATSAGGARMRIATSGGASLPPEVLRSFESRFGTPILEGYGLTETTGTATFNSIDRNRKVGATGRPLPGVEMRILDAEGTEVTPGEVGEIELRGPTVMKGYWRRPDATAQAFHDGWFRTGDLGAVDQDGDVRIVDRMKDLIIRGGYNVYPREVEEVLYEHEDILDVAVVGVPDEYRGEEVCALVVVRDGSGLDAAQIRDWAKERLSAYKVPHRIRFAQALPVGPSGKVLKRAIDVDAFLEPEIVARNG